METSTLPKKWEKRLSLHGFSIQQRLPLLICVLLLSMIIIFSWVSYIGVKNAAIKSGNARLHTLTDQLSTMFSQSSLMVISATRNAATKEPIRKCLLSPESETWTEAFPILQKLREDSSSVLIELLNAKKQPILRSGKDSIQLRVGFDSLLASFAKLDTGTIGKLYQLNGSMYYPIIVGVTDNNAIIGYIVRWKMITTTPKTLQQLSQLLGTSASFYVGNADESLWTDMIRPINNPLPADASSKAGILEYKGANGDLVFGAERPVRNTPWQLLIEFPRQSVLEPAQRFLQWIVLIGGALMAIGIFIVWIMSRNITRPLNKLTEAIAAITEGNNPPAVIVNRKDEVGELARAFNAMISQVQQAKYELEQKVIETEQMNEQLHDLSEYLQNIREEERIHIAREMHDELGQLLTAYKMDVSWLNKRLSGAEDGAIKERLSEMSSIVDQTISFVRRIAAELRPSLLDDLGLVPALEWHSREFTKRFNIEATFNSTASEFHTSDTIATGMFRMYQESLTNVARHSAAKKVVSNLQVSAGQICLSITDDGKGFDTSAKKGKTLGLLGMKERALMLGGKLEILSEPGAGATVIITVPLSGRAINQSKRNLATAE